jgi:hypothetical protein
MKGEEVTEGIEGYHIRERPADYKTLFGVQQDDIGFENTYCWNTKIE